MPVHLLVISLYSVGDAFSYFVSVLQNTVLILMFTVKCIKFVTPVGYLDLKCIIDFFLAKLDIHM